VTGHHNGRLGPFGTIATPRTRSVGQDVERLDNAKSGDNVNGSNSTDKWRSSVTLLAWPWPQTIVNNDPVKDPANLDLIINVPFLLIPPLSPWTVER
jgi:hypothetical protein